MRGMVLVAGKGTRLRPLTNSIAKPTLPLPGAPILIHILNLLQEAKVKDVALNLHYQPDSIQHLLKHKSVKRMNISAFNEPILSGSGGGFFRIKEFFKKKSFLMVNGDSIPIIDLNKIIDFHNSHELPITFLCQPDKSGKKRVIRADVDMDVVSIRQQPEYSGKSFPYRFCGVMVIDSEIFELQPDNLIFDFFGDLLIPELNKGNKIGKVFSDDFKWYDFGTVEDFYHNSFQFLMKEFQTSRHVLNFEKNSDFFIHKTASVDYTVRLNDFGYIGNKSKILGDIDITSSIIHENVVLRDAKIENSIIFPGAYPPGIEISNSILTKNGEVIAVK